MKATRNGSGQRRCPRSVESAWCPTKSLGPRADLVVWVRVPRRVCLWGLTCRVASSFGRVRADMAPGCPEQLPDREFLSYIWNFERRVSPLIVDRLGRYSPGMPVLQLRSRRDMGALVARLQGAVTVG